MQRSEFYFFWSSPFSQWAHYPIIMNDGKEYNTNEQYMMAEKARLFGDKEAEKQIMDAIDPAKQKALGRTVKNFDQKIWESKCRDIVYEANLAKFTQHLFLKNKLLQTGNKIIVEASPEDKVWGIGLRESDARACELPRPKGQWLPASFAPTGGVL